MRSICPNSERITTANWAIRSSRSEKSTVRYLIPLPLLNSVIINGIWLIFSWLVALNYAVIIALLALAAPLTWQSSCPKTACATWSPKTSDG